MLWTCLTCHGGETDESKGNSGRAIGRLYIALLDKVNNVYNPRPMKPKDRRQWIVWSVSWRNTSEMWAPLSLASKLHEVRLELGHSSDVFNHSFAKVESNISLSNSQNFNLSFLEYMRVCCCECMSCYLASYLATPARGLRRTKILKHIFSSISSRKFFFF